MLSTIAHLEQFDVFHALTSSQVKLECQVTF